MTKPAPRKATERSAPTEPVSPPSAASTRAADPISTPLRRLDEDAGDTFLGRTARSYQVSSPLEERPKVKRHRAVPARETTSHGGSGALYGIGIFLLATRIAPKWIGDDTVVIVAAAVFAVVVRQIYLRFNVGVFLPCLILGYVAVSRDWAGLNEMLRVRLEHADFTPLVSVAGVLTCLLGRLIQE